MSRDYVAGIVGVAVSAYLVVVVPAILAPALGLPRESLVTACALSLSFGTLVMGLFKGRPYAQGPGIVLAPVVAGYATDLGATATLGLVQISVVLTLLLVLSPHLKRFLMALPQGFKATTTLAIGVFMMGVAFEQTLVQISGELSGKTRAGIVALAFFLGMFVSILVARRIVQGRSLPWMMAKVPYVLLQLYAIAVLGFLYLEPSASADADRKVGLCFMGVVVIFGARIIPRLRDLSYALCILFVCAMEWIFSPETRPSALIATPTLEGLPLSPLALVGAVGEINPWTAFTAVIGIAFLHLLDVFPTAQTCEAVYAKQPDVAPESSGDETALVMRRGMLANLFNPVLGLSPTFVLFENLAVIESGGRGIRCTLTMSVLFLALVFFWPLAAAVPPAAGIAVLVVIGTSIVNFGAIQFAQVPDRRLPSSPLGAKMIYPLVMAGTFVFAQQLSVAIAAALAVAVPFHLMRVEPQAEGTSS